MIHRFWLDQMKNTLGFVDILQNTKMDQCMHGNRVQHLGVLKDRHIYATGNMPNWQKARIRMSISRIKNRISEAATEACGYSPLTKVVSEEEINRILEQESGWIPVDEQIPNTDKYILVSFENFTIPDIGRYETDEDGNGAFYPGDDDKSYAKYGLFVNAWMPLPESYSTDAEKPHIEKPQTNADRIRSMTDDELLDFLCSIETYEQGSVKTIEGGVAMCSVTEVEQWLKAESEG